MARTMEEINAEKRLKPRPDLIPAHVLNRFWDETADTDFDADASELDPSATLALFGETGAVDYLFEAMAEVAVMRVARGEYGHAMAMGRVLAYGLNKHGVCTWRVPGTEQASQQTHYASAMRHLLEYALDPSACEEGSGFPVLDHALTQMAILADLVMNPPTGPAGVNDGQWAIKSAQVPAEPWALPKGAEWGHDYDGTWMVKVEDKGTVVQSLYGEVFTDDDDDPELQAIGRLVDKRNRADGLLRE